MDSVKVDGVERYRLNKDFASSSKHTHTSHLRPKDHFLEVPFER